MRILKDNTITSVDSECLTSPYLNNGLEERHPCAHVLMDYPSIKWIPSFPDTRTYGPNLELYSTVTGAGTDMNGIYLGMITADEVSITIRQGSTIIINDFRIQINSHKDNHCFYSLQEMDPTAPEFLSGDYEFSLELICYKDIWKGDSALWYKSPTNNMYPSAYGILYYQTFHNYWTGSTYTVPVYGTTAYRSILKGNFFRTITPNSGSPYHEVTSISDMGFGESVKIGSILRLQSRLTGSQWYVKTYEITGDGTSTNDAIKILIDAAPSGSEYDIIGQYLSPSIGIVRMGNIENYPNPQTGMTRVFQDYSRRRELPNGNYQFRNRNVSKGYNGSLILDRDLMEKFSNFAFEQRAKPFPVEILTNMEAESPTCIFGYFKELPAEVYNHRMGTIKELNFTIQEAL